MVIVHICADDGDEFLLETRCSVAMRDVKTSALALYNLRAQLRAALAKLPEPSQHALDLLSRGAVRRKQVLTIDMLKPHLRAAEALLDSKGNRLTDCTLLPEATTSLKFGQRELPCDSTSLSQLTSTNEKCMVRICLVRLGDEATCVKRRRVEVVEEVDGEELTMLNFVKSRSAGPATDGSPPPCAPADECGDEESPRLTADHLRRLCLSPRLRTALRSTELQELLAMIDRAGNPEAELERALSDPRFREFVHIMLVDSGIRSES